MPNGRACHTKPRPSLPPTATAIGLQASPAPPPSGRVAWRQSTRTITLEPAILWIRRPWPSHGRQLPPGAARMYLSPRAARLLADVEQSHLALIEWTKADESARHGFRAVYEAFSAGMADMTEDELIAAPAAEEWSMAEVAEHVAEH